jgi:hypothetical protein
VKTTCLSNRRRRGHTIVEVALAGTMMLSVVGLLASFVTFSTRVWHSSMAQSASQFSGQAAMERFGPLVRNARRVITAGDHALTIQEPAFDASGNLVLPLQDGDVYSFYLSDTTGSPSHTGTIFWRSVNNVPDTAWSLRNGQGRIQVASGGLTFSYYPTASPETVTVALATQGSSGNRSSQFPASEEFKLRNKGL